MRYLSIALLSKINKYNESSLILNINNYIDSILNNINKFEDIKSIYLVSKVVENYNKKIEFKINKYKTLLNEKIKPLINENIDSMQNATHIYINEISELKKEYKDKLSEIIKLQSKIKKSLKRKEIFTLVEIGCIFFACTSGMGMLAIESIQLGFAVTESLMSGKLDSDGITKGLLSVVSTTKDNVKLMKDKYTDIYQVFSKQLDSVEKDLASIDTLSTNMNELKVNVSRFKTELDSTMQEIENTSFFNIKSRDNISKIDKLREEFYHLFESKISELEKENKDSNSKSSVHIPSSIYIEADLARIKNIYGGVIAINSIGHYYDSIKDNTAKVDAYADAILSIDLKMDLLDKLENDMYDIILPFMENMDNYILDLKSDLEKNSDFSIPVISKWEIKRIIDSIKYKISIITKDLELDQEDPLLYCITELQNSMDSMIEMYAAIESYRDQQALASLIEEVNNSKNIGISIKDKELENTVNSLELTIRGNLILDMYDNLYKSILHHTFPFPQLFFDFELPSVLQPNHNDSLISNVTYIAQNIKSIKNKFYELNINFNKNYNTRHSNAIFNSKEGSLGPFYYWKSDKYHLNISSLFSGEKIVLIADIIEGLPQNAIKFKTICADFILKNGSASDQRELYTLLSYFHIVLEHQGDNHYRCNDNIYTMKSTDATISYSFDQRGDGVCEDLNDMLIVLENNNPFLSPYTEWHLSFNPKDGNHSRFDTLEKYKNDTVRIELQGMGQYIETGSNVCNNLSIYYSSDYTMIQDISFTTRSDENKRKRRSVDSYQSIENIRPVSSGSSSNMHSSLIKSISDLFHKSFVRLNPISRISNWFSKDRNNVYQESLNMLDNNLVYGKMINIEYSSIELPPSLPRISDNKSSTNINSIENNLVSNSTLLLSDYLIRLKTGVKYRNRTISEENNTHIESAQALAYRGYLPKDLKESTQDHNLQRKEFQKSDGQKCSANASVCQNLVHSMSSLPINNNIGYGGTTGLHYGIELLNNNISDGSEESFNSSCEQFKYKVA
ncbi:hypothetical protein ACRRVD_03040 [Candidatus Cardinium hertigii]|uniref:hypothetical protein n=1 Tax=Candidatus Cardinium hertigii TaxID=247481 RepID=UPI003D7DA7BC